MTIKKRLEQLENQAVCSESPVAMLESCDPLSLAFFVAEAHGQLAGLADPHPTPSLHRAFEYIRQHPEKYPVNNTN